MREADRLVLLVSKASLESPWTRDEWEGMARKGSQLVLAVFEPVELPGELRDLPTYDFRSGFRQKVQDLIAYLQGDGAPRHDRIPAPNMFLDTLAEMSQRFEVDIFVNVLMDSHLLFRSKRANLSKSMQWLGATFTKIVDTIKGRFLPETPHMKLHLCVYARPS